MIKLRNISRKSSNILKYNFIKYSNVIVDIFTDTFYVFIKDKIVYLSVIVS